MPFYTFKCTKCEYAQDYLVPMGTKEWKCKKCGERAVYQLSFRFAAHGLPNGHITTRGDVKN